MVYYETNYEIIMLKINLIKKIQILGSAYKHSVYEQVRQIEAYTEGNSQCPVRGRYEPHSRFVHHQLKIAG